MDQDRKEKVLRNKILENDKKLLKKQFQGRTFSRISKHLYNRKKSI